MKKLLLLPLYAAAFACLFVGKSEAQNLTRLCITTNGSNCVEVRATNPLPVTGTISATSTARATAAAPAYVEGTDNPFSVDLSGNLRTLASVTLTLPTIGAAVPATGIYNGLNVAGTLRGMTGLALGATFSQTVAIVDAAGAQVTSFGASNASVSATAGAVPASATYAGINVGGNLTGAVGGHGTAASALRVELPTDGTGVIASIGSITNTVTVSPGVGITTPISGAISGTVTAVQATGTNLHVVCDSGCSSSSAPADASTFTFSTTSQTPVGGVFQTTATNNALTTGQMGAFQVTANRALFTNLRNASGTEVGTSTTPLQVTLANTGANATAVKVDGSAVTQPVSVAATLVITPAAGVIENTSATQAGTWNITNVSGTVSLPTGAAIATNQTAIQTPIAAAAATATKGVLLGGQYDTTQKTLSGGQQGAVSLSPRAAIYVATGAEVLSDNIAQVNGVTVNTGAGAASTGSQRIAVGTDVNTIAGSAPGTAGTPSSNVITIQGVTSMTKLLVTPDSVALPSNQSVNVSQINGVAPLMGNGVTGTGSQRVTLATDNSAITQAGFMSVKLDQTTPGTTNAVSIAQIGGTTIVNGGVAGSQSVGGTVATNVAITANPLNLGAQAVSSENTLVTTARQVQLVADLAGKLITLPYSNPENFVSGVITTPMVLTASTQLIVSPAAGLRNYITSCTVSNAHATVGTDLILQDGSGGTTIWNIPAAAVYGGAHIVFPTPLRQPTTATALFISNVTTGASTKAACNGYKGG